MLEDGECQDSWQEQQDGVVCESRRCGTKEPFDKVVVDVGVVAVPPEFASVIVGSAADRFLHIDV